MRLRNRGLSGQDGWRNIGDTKHEAYTFMDVEGVPHFFVIMIV